MIKFNIIKLLLVLIFFYIDCTGDKGPVIKLGKIFDKEKIEVSDENNTFKINDNFAYSLSQSEPFNSEIITRRFYHGKEYIDMIQKESIDINIKPDTKRIGESIPVEKLVQKFGSGDYLLLFIIKDFVIAKKSFYIEEKTFKTPKISNEQTNMEMIQKRSEKAISDMPDSPPIVKNTLTPGKNVAEEGIQRERLIPKRQEKNIPISPNEMLK
jgi:hypothetical protein